MIKASSALENYATTPNYPFSVKNNTAMSVSHLHTPVSKVPDGEKQSRNFDFKKFSVSQQTGADPIASMPVTNTFKNDEH